jgi:hypothetical protein
MGCLNGKEFARPRTDHAESIHPQVITVLRASRLAAFLIPPPAGPGIAFKTRFIAEPDLRILLFAQHAKFIQKGVP